MEYCAFYIQFVESGFFMQITDYQIGNILIKLWLESVKLLLKGLGRLYMHFFVISFLSPLLKLKGKWKYKLKPLSYPTLPS